MKKITRKLRNGLRHIGTWWDGLQARPTRLSVVLCGLVGVLGVTVGIMWVRASNETQKRCESLNVVAHLFQDVGNSSAVRPDPKLFQGYIALKAYSSNHPDRLGAAFLVQLLENQFSGNGPASPTGQLLQKAGRELEEACS